LWSAPRADRIGNRRHDNRNRRRGALGRLDAGRVGRNDDVDLQPNQLRRQIGQTIGTSLCRTKLEGEIAAFDVAEFAQSFAQLLAERFRIRSRQDERSDPRRSALLRARRERPRSCAAEQRDELGASYSYHFQARQMGTSCTESVRDALAQTLGFVIRSRFTRSPRRRAVGTILGWLDPTPWRS